MGKVKVLQVIGSLQVGGAETVAMNFFRYIDRNKFHFDYLVYGEEIGAYENEVYALGGRVLRVPSPKNGYFRFYKAVRKIMRDNGPYDIVHSHTLFNSGIIMYSAKAEKIPRRIAHAHTDHSKLSLFWQKKVYNKFMRYLLLKYATDYCACANAAGRYVFGKEAFSKKGIIIRNGIEVDKFTYSVEKRLRIRRELSLENKTVIGHIGRLVKAKNHSFMLDIFKTIHEKDENTSLLLVGDGELRNEIEEKIKLLNLQDSVIMTGTRTDIPDLLSAMDIFILPSLNEGLGIVLIEAQANGLPCIAESGIVPLEARILDNFYFVSPNASLDEWVAAIMANSKVPRAIGATLAVQKAGYDVQSIGKVLEQLYYSKPENA